MSAKTRLASKLRLWADRLDYDGAMKYTSWTFTFEDRIGVKFRSDGKGCPITYFGNDDYARAHTESDSYGRHW